MMMLGVLFQGPRCNSKYGRCSYAKMKNQKKYGMVGDDVGGVVSGSRVHFHVWKVWLCKNEKW
jgi:hypothetical protein